MINHSNVLEHFFWLTTEPFFHAKGILGVYWVIQGRCHELLNSLGITLKRIREEATDLKKLNLGSIEAQFPLQALLLDEEVFYRTICTLVENVMALTPLFVREGGIPQEKPTTPRKLIKLLKAQNLEPELCEYLEQQFGWYQQIAEILRNPMTHVGSMRYMDASNQGQLSVGLISIPKYDRTSQPQMHKLTADLEQLIREIRTTVGNLLDFLIFYTDHFFERLKVVYEGHWPDVASVNLSALHGCAEITKWSNGKTI